MKVSPDDSGKNFKNSGGNLIHPWKQDVVIIYFFLNNKQRCFNASLHNDFKK